MTLQAREERKRITLDFVKGNIGEVIEWFCYGYHLNNPYAGVCRIIGIKEGEMPNEPKIVVEHVSGDNLNYAWFENGVLNYTDSGRNVFVGKEFEFIALTWSTPSYANLETTVINYLDNPKGADFLIKKATTSNDVLLGGIPYTKVDGFYSIKN